MSLASENITKSPGTFVQDLLREEKMHRVLSIVQKHIPTPILPKATYEWDRLITEEVKRYEAVSADTVERYARIAALAISAIHQYVL